MSYKETYESTIWNVIQLLSTYKSYVEQNDLNNLYKTKAILVAEKAILNQIYADSNGLYLDKKSEYSDKKDELYLAYCETETNGIADRRSRLDSTGLRGEMNTLLTKRNKAQKMIEDVKDVIIEIAVILKDKRNEETYG